MPLFGRGSRPTGKAGEWFWCVRHHKVEEGPECPAKDRLGPYATPQEAARALDTAAARNREWDTDPRWSDGTPREGSGDADDA